MNGGEATQLTLVGHSGCSTIVAILCSNIEHTFLKFKFKCSIYSDSTRFQTHHATT